MSRPPAAWSRRAVLRALSAVAGGGATASILAACRGSSAGPASSTGVPTVPGEVTAPATVTSPSAGILPSDPAIPATTPNVSTTQPAPTTVGAPQVGYPRANRPVELPDNGLTPVATGTAPEAGPLRILNYPDYINPDVVAAFEQANGVAVVVDSYDEVAEAEARIATPGHGYDLVLGLPSLAITPAVLGALVQPLNRELISNFGNVFAGLQDPYYDVGAKYSIPYSVYTTGISYRRDQVSEQLFNRDDAWPLLWDATYAGKVGMLPDVRDGLALGLVTNGAFDLNTEDPATIDAAAGVLEQLVASMSPVFDIYSYENIPNGVTQMQQAWSGDMLQARSYLLEGQTSEILGYWHPTRAPVSNDMFMVCAGAASPVLAHRFIDFLLDPVNAATNFDYVGYQPAVASPTAFDLINSGAVPEHLLSCLVYDADVAIGYRIDPIQPASLALWDTAWARVTGG